MKYYSWIQDHKYKFKFCINEFIWQKYLTMNLYILH